MQCYSPSYTGLYCSNGIVIHIASMCLLNILAGGIGLVLQPRLHRFVLQQSKYSTYLITVLLPLNFNILVEDVDAVS